MIVQIHRAGDRFVTRSGGVQSHHSFSFGRHYDPANISFGPLVAVNDEHVTAGAGFEPHPHRDLEIVSWVVEGELLHDDDAGHRGVTAAGGVQRLSAGRGVVHSERCEVDTRFVQSWLQPDDPGGQARHATELIDPAALRNRLAVVASGFGAGLSIGCRGAGLLAGRLDDAVTVEVPAAPFRHVLVAVGGAQLSTGQTLVAGDAARVTGNEALTVTAVGGPCEILAWVMQVTSSTGEHRADQVR